jgi:hypothetical protein
MPMLVVDRDSFMAWMQGILLERDAEGYVLVGDSVDNERAEDALEKGETIGLTVDGRLVSTLRDAGEEIVEEEIRWER